MADIAPPPNANTPAGAGRSERSATWDIRPATIGDTETVHELLGELGYAFPLSYVTPLVERLLATGGDPIYLAEENGAAVGMMALHRAEMLHKTGPVLKITALVVRDAARGRGIGRALVEHARAVARELGCTDLELNSGMQRTEAHAFYERLGFERSSYRFHRAP